MVNCCILSIPKCLPLISCHMMNFEPCQHPRFRNDCASNTSLLQAVRIPTWNLMKPGYAHCVPWTGRYPFKVHTKLPMIAISVMFCIRLLAFQWSACHTHWPCQGYFDKWKIHGKILNGLDFPMWKDSQWDHCSYATDMVAWDYVHGKQCCGTVTTPYLTEHVRWGLAATAHTFTSLHIDSDGFSTFM